MLLAPLGLKGHSPCSSLVTPNGGSHMLGTGIQKVSPHPIKRVRDYQISKAMPIVSSRPTVLILLIWSFLCPKLLLNQKATTILSCYSATLYMLKFVGPFKDCKKCQLQYKNIPEHAELPYQWWRDPFMCNKDHIRSYNVKSHWKGQEVNSAPE